MVENSNSVNGEGECKKCESRISKTAKRCPQCGYEPGNSLFSKLVYWLITFPWTVIFVLLFLAGLVGALIGEISVSEFIGAVIAIGILGALPFWHVGRYTKRKMMSATGDIDEEEVSRYGKLGGRIGEKIKKFVKSPFN